MRKAVYGLFALSLSIIACIPLFSSEGIVNTREGGDSPFLLVRLHQLLLNLRGGVFPARWMPDAAYGLGYPFFNYYASFPYYIAALFKLWGFGYISSIKLTQSLGFVGAALAIYILAYSILKRPSAAFLATIVYTYAPFHIVNVYVRGDSLSEFFAFLFYPLIFWSLLRLARSQSVKDLALVALTYGGLVLTHNASALIFSPFVGLWLIALSLYSTGDRRASISYMLYAFGGISLGLALSAWFWMPALFEGEYVRLETMTTGYFHYSGHFRSLDLVQTSPFFDYEFRQDNTPFAMSLAQTLLSLLGLFSILIRWIKRGGDKTSASFVLILAISTFLITPLSRPLWDNLPLLPFVQFPWRFLSVQAFAIAIIAGYLGVELAEGRLRFLIPLPGALILTTSMLSLKVEHLPIGEADVTRERIMLYEYFTANIGTTIRSEYLPRWVTPRPFTSEVFFHEVNFTSDKSDFGKFSPKADFIPDRIDFIRDKSGFGRNFYLKPSESQAKSILSGIQVTSGKKPFPIVMSGEVTRVELMGLGPTWEEWDISVSSPRAELAFHTHYFPGWRGYVDGELEEIWPVKGSGYIGLGLSKGEHRVLLKLERTPVRAFSEGLSLIASFAVIGLILARRPFASFWRNWVKAAFFLLASSLSIGFLLRLTPSGEPNFSDLTMDFLRMPYLHHNPEGVDFGGKARLISYSFSKSEIAAGEKLSVTLLWEDVSEGPSADVRLVSPFGHLFHVPSSLAGDSAPLQASTQHELQVPKEIVRGIYFIEVRVADGETFSTFLRPVRIFDGTFAKGDEPVLARFGPSILLNEVDTEQKEAGALDVRLTWQATKPIPANYVLSLRLKDAEGKWLTSLDVQPHYGFYPTSMWREGELILDSHLLRLPEGTPPGDDYRLEVVLYEASTLSPIGVFEIPNVKLTEPTIRSDYPIAFRFGEELALVDLRAQTHLKQGQPFVVEAKWAALTKPSCDYAFRLSLLSSSGDVVHSEAFPISPSYPTSLWPPDALIASRYKLRLSPFLPPGSYGLVLTVFDTITGDSFGEFHTQLTIEIEGRERSYVVPPIQTEVKIDFGGRMRLLGYDLLREGDELSLSLYWQALKRMERDYKVFVHLFDPTTERILVQHDFVPSLPTSWWAEGEIIKDEVSLRVEGIPSGRYRLAVGVYDPMTLSRLSASDSEGLPIPDDRFVTSEEVNVP